MWGGVANLRVLIDELGRVVDLVVDDHVQVVLGVVLRNILIREFGRHRDGVLLGICRGADRKVSGGCSDSGASTGDELARGDYGSEAGSGRGQV